MILSFNDFYVSLQLRKLLRIGHSYIKIKIRISRLNNEKSLLITFMILEQIYKIIIAHFRCFFICFFSAFLFDLRILFFLFYFNNHISLFFKSHFYKLLYSSIIAIRLFHASFTTIDEDS